ncbi:MAG: hypothetical protein IPG61_17490 [bacterium]|nr:hypothetical protein [bacterium]
MMPLWFRSASVLVFLLSAAAVRAACPEPAALPDTAGFAVEVATLRALPPEARAALAARAAAACEPWVGEFRARDGKVARSLDVIFSRGCLSRWRTGLHGSQLLLPNDQLVTANADFTAALAADPCCLTALVARGLVRKAAGEPRAAIADWSRALRLLEDADAEEADKDAAAMRASLRRTAGWACLPAAALAWEQAEAAATMMVGRQGRRPDGPALIHGSAWPAAGETAEAIDWTGRMPPIEYRHTSSLSAGYEASPGSFANDWIRSQALLADGDFAGARWALGDIDGRRFHNLPLADVYWQDAGLVCELAGDRDAGRCYERAHSRAPCGSHAQPKARLPRRSCSDFPRPACPSSRPATALSQADRRSVSWPGRWPWLWRKSSRLPAKRRDCAPWNVVRCLFGATFGRTSCGPCVRDCTWRLVARRRQVPTCSMRATPSRCRA